MMTEFARFIADGIAETGWSNDVPLLETQDHWYVFTYANRRGKSSAYFTHENSEASFVGIAWTKSPIYTILKVETPKKELYLADLSGTDRILGELWKVPTHTLLDLDCDERNLLRTRRIQAPIHVGGRGDVSAWVYTIDRKFLVDGGAKVSKFTPRTYYGSESFIELTP